MQELHTFSIHLSLYLNWYCLLAGLGSHLCESIRDDYPMAYIMSAVIGPHVSGESPLQHYNTLLSLSWLQRLVLMLCAKLPMVITLTHYHCY